MIVSMVRLRAVSSRPPNRMLNTNTRDARRFDCATDCVSADTAKHIDVDVTLTTTSDNVKKPKRPSARLRPIMW
jgi:hypothetical protein